VILGGVHHIEGGEVDATDGAAPATDAATRLRERTIGVDVKPRIQGAKGRAKTLPFVFCAVRCALAGAATTAYLDKAQVSVR
jgi:hypothetical protein